MKILFFKVLSDFRNLRGVELHFDPKINTYVLIGNNGAGKSSLLEALSSIFQTLFLDGFQPFEFAFSLRFESEGRTIQIVNQLNSQPKFKLDNRDSNRNAILAYLPRRVICNYSGEENRINNLYYRPVWEQYEQRLKATSGGDALRMVFVDKDLWKIILFVIVAHQDRYQSFKTFLKDILHIGSVTQISIDIDITTLESWSDNPVSFYMRQLARRIQADGTITLPDINPDENEALFMFNHLSSARSLIKDIHVVFDNGGASDFLSEGEKKWMVVLFILEVISDEQSLVLLDEPDSHIHVARQNQMAELFRKAVNRDNIVTSHSPTLTAAFDQNEIIMLDRGPDGCAKVVDADKQKVISDITGGMWSLQRQNIFLSSNNDIILVEGKTDETFLSKALEIFHAKGRFRDQTYEFLPCGGASGVALLQKYFWPKENQHIYCFFDSDDAGWQGINSIFKPVKGKRFSSRNFGKAQKSGHIWVIPYPFPKRSAKSYNIEDYFPRRIFLHYVLSFCSLNEVFDKDKLKKAFEDDCNAGKLKADDFKKFSIVFELLDEIRAADAAGKDHI